MRLLVVRSSKPIFGREDLDRPAFVDRFRTNLVMIASHRGRPELHRPDAVTFRLSKREVHDSSIAANMNILMLTLSFRRFDYPCSNDGRIHLHGSGGTSSHTTA